LISVLTAQSLSAQTAELIPISGQLTLADVVLTGAGEGSFVVQLDGLHMQVPMHRKGDAWAARVMLGPDADARMSGRIMTADRSGEIVATFSGSTAPPTDQGIPDWALGAVWYQIFPERFRNANTDNDPVFAGAYRFPWNADWDDVTADELEAGWIGAVAGQYAHDPHRRGGMKYNLIWHRRYGGDIQGVEQQLDTLQDLGVTGIYFCPIFQSQSLHKYNATDFRHLDENLAHPGTPPKQFRHDPSETVDPQTWTWLEGDRYFIDVFLPECKRRGIRVIIDGVWNHVGRDFWAFEHVLEHGTSSPYADWFDIRFNDAGQVIGWDAWDKENGHLPQFRRDETGNIVEPVRNHIFDVTRRWMDPNGDGDPSDGIDGWRLDVAAEIPTEFWREWRRLVRSINPDSILVGEIWFDAGKYFDGVAFDSQMNYPFAFATTHWLTTDTPDSAELISALENVFDHNPHNDLAQFNLLDSHDVERIVSMLANPGRGYDQTARFHVDADGYNAQRPTDDTYERLVASQALQATYLGSPMIYNGTEYGVYGADDPDNRKVIPWGDAGPYADPDEHEMPALRERIASWYRLRSDPEVGPILRYGDVEHVPTGRPDVFAFRRSLNDASVLVVINRGSVPYNAASLPRPSAHADQLLVADPNSVCMIRE